MTNDVLFCFLPGWIDVLVEIVARGEGGDGGAVCLAIKMGFACSGSIFKIQPHKFEMKQIATGRT